MNIIEFLNQIWTQILDVTALFVTPDWGFLISMLPVMVLLGLVMPFLTGLALGSPSPTSCASRGPRSPSRRARASPRSAPGGEPVFPVGLPHCRRDALIYPSGTLRCDTCHDELAVICPMCGLGRMARIDTCSNCGLVLKVKTRAVAVRTTAGPKPGGAAAA